MEPHMASHTTLPLTGGCQCGAVRYEVNEAPGTIYVCHCRECRRQSASAFGISVTVPRAALRVVRGALKVWARATDSGNRLECYFCPECGSRLWHQSAISESSQGAADVSISIKGGSLDEPLDVSDAIHIWTSRKLPGVVIPPRAQQFSQEPA
jgi:hypothetical protein